MHVLGWLRRHLQAKVLSCIVVILLVGFGILGVWNIRMQSAVLLEQRKEAARGLADAIVTSIESSMLEGRPDIVRVLSRHLHTVKEVEQITIFRTDGVEDFADLDAIVTSIESSMLEGRTDIVRVLSRHLHTVKEVEQITIFRTNGVEAFADLATL